MAREVKVAILGDARDFSRAMRQVTGEADGFGRKLARFGKVAAVGLAAAGAGAVALGKSFVDAAIESQKVTAQTGAVIKSMGNSSNITAEQVAKLATQLSLKSGIDDELIQSGSNVLLTFGKIRNEVGKGNNAFDRATQSALDMSVALKMDMKSASILVGKALNDPIKGLTSLTRSGIQFTEQQKDQIKAMVAVGDTAGAQKVILGELEKQFGGSAAAQATAVDRLKVAWGNVQEELGARLLPVVERVATFLAENLPTAIDRANAAFEAVRPVVESIVAVVREKWPQIQQVISGVIAAVQNVISGFVAVITTLWNNFGNNLLEFMQRVWPNIRQVIEGALNIIQGVIKTITSLIKGDWSGVWEGIKQIVAGAWGAIQGLVKASLEQLRLAVGVGLEVIGSLIKGAWNGIVDFIKGLPGRIATAAEGLFDALKEAATDAAKWVLAKIDSMLGPLDEVIGKLGKIGGGITRGIGGAVGKLPFLDHGGIMPGPRGVHSLAMVAGGETVIPTHKSGFGMGSSYVINVTAGLGANGRDIGEQVVEVIRAYERRNGSSWRAA